MSKTSNYNWSTAYAFILRQLRNSKTLKEKHGWSRESGSGFVAEDILHIKSIEKKIEFEFAWGKQILEISELNLRETEEVIKFLEKKNG